MAGITSSFTALQPGVAQATVFFPSSVQVASFTIVSAPLNMGMALRERGRKYERFCFSTALAGSLLQICFVPLRLLFHSSDSRPLMFHSRYRLCPKNSLTYSTVWPFSPSFSQVAFSVTSHSPLVYVRWQKSLPPPSPDRTWYICEPAFRPENRWPPAESPTLHSSDEGSDPAPPP